MGNFKTFDEREREAYIEGRTQEAALLREADGAAELESDAEKQVEELQEQIRDLESDAQEREEELQSQISQLEDEISELEADNHALEMKLWKAEDRLHALAYDLDVLAHAIGPIEFDSIKCLSEQVQAIIEGMQ
jgi:chromosome segregation ATPase